jgi:hypothetical protein
VKAMTVNATANREKYVIIQSTAEDSGSNKANIPKKGSEVGG